MVAKRSLAGKGAFPSRAWEREETKMVAKFNLADKRAFPSRAWERGDNAKGGVRCAFPPYGLFVNVIKVDIAF